VHEKFSLADKKIIGLCALLHDVGKTKIDTELLKAPRKLTDAEFQAMTSHTIHGYEILSTCKFPSEAIKMDQMFPELNLSLGNQITLPDTTINPPSSNVDFDSSFQEIVVKTGDMYVIFYNNLTVNINPGTQITIIDTGCGTTEGIYTYSINGDILNFVMISDPCTRYAMMTSDDWNRP